MPTCPLCQRPIAPPLTPFLKTPQPRIALALAELHGDVPSALCPDCLYVAVLQSNAQRSPTPISEGLQIPYPVYSPYETDLLPTPLRVHANPGFTGRGVTIAFLDSGFYPHLDLIRPNNRILAHYDATTSEVQERKRFKAPQVTSWHGLMTSSIGAGSGFSSDGMFRGVASGASLLFVKTGSTRRRGIGERDIARSLRWVIENYSHYNVRVINISLGGDHPSTGKLTDLDSLVEEAVARGMVVVCAAGNSGSDRVVPPASAPSAITVGGMDDGNSLDHSHWRMWHSNFGHGAYGVHKPDVLAPAIWLAAPMLPKTSTHNEALFMFRVARASDEELERILQTDYAQARFRRETLRLSFDDIRRIVRGYMIEQKYIHPHYQHVDGTSMATPIVSGVVAQMIEANPSLSPAQIKERIHTTARLLPDVPGEVQGRGVINAARAVAAAMRAPGGPMRGLPISPYLTDEYVNFYLHEPKALTVELTGSFNDWQPVPLQKVLSGAWRISLPRLHSGEYRYKFLIDSQRWINDPENANVVEDGVGGYHSVVIVE